MHILRDGFSLVYFRLSACLHVILTFSSIHVFRPECQIWEPVRRDTKTYVRRILNIPCMQEFINAHFTRFRYYGTKLIVDIVNSKYVYNGSL